VANKNVGEDGAIEWFCAVKDQIIADANARTSIRDAFNATVLPTVSTKAYFQMISRKLDGI
jgi:hypothetical protein